MDDAADPTPRRGGGNALAVVGWLFFAGIVAGLIAFLYVGRASVVRALLGWPLWVSRSERFMRPNSSPNTR